MRMGWAGYIADVLEMRNGYKILFGKPERKRPLAITRHRWTDNIIMDFKKCGTGLQVVFICFEIGTSSGLL
jgi:hypothetical protein